MAGTKSTAKQNWRQCLAGVAGFKVVHSRRNNFRLIGLEDETITSGHLRRWPVDIPVHFTFRKGGMCDPRPERADTTAQRATYDSVTLIAEISDPKRKCEVADK